MKLFLCFRALIWPLLKLISKFNYQYSLPYWGSIAPGQVLTDQYYKYKEYMTRIKMSIATHLKLLKVMGMEILSKITNNIMIRRFTIIFISKFNKQ